VAAAIEGAFFGITSVAVSLEYDPHADFAQAARIARHVIQQVLERGVRPGQLLNLNIPTAATRGRSRLVVVPMGVGRYGERFLKRQDPRGRTYYWATSDPPPKPTDHDTDLTALERGHVTLSPLYFDLTRHDDLLQLADWHLTLPD
jgi:5'-nucleotidase